MVRRLCSAGAGVEVVVGPPGTGKTFALDAASSIWAASGTAVVGTALAARTARALQVSTGMPCFTLDGLLSDLARPEGALAPGSVVLVDEAGMVGTRTLARLLSVAERLNTKVVLVGDPAQLPELEAGGAFRALARSFTPIELSVNRRQVHAWERVALDHIRTGEASLAVDAYRRAGRLTLVANGGALQDVLVADWAATLGERSVMVALTHAEVEDLNAKARAHLVSSGLLPAHGIEIAGVLFGVGDRVITLRNDRRLGVLNGTLGILVSTEPDGSVVFCPDGAEVPVVLPGPYLAKGHLSHAWAITAHKAQGMTTERAFVLGSERLYREAGYVALSRATQETQWYQVLPERSIEELRTPEADVARLLAASGAQHLATGVPGWLAARRAIDLALEPERSLGVGVEL